MTIPAPIVSTKWLADRIDDPRLRLFDASVYLTPKSDGPGYITESGRTRWAKAHIPGANFLDMLADFCDTSHPVPMTRVSDERFAQLCAAHGIGNGTTVVIYSGQTLMWSARMWWMLRAVGFNNAAILDGGPQQWAREGRPMSNEDKPYSATTFAARPNPGMWVDKADVHGAIHDPAVCTINALQPDVYDGRINRYGRQGHIPGSHNVYYSSLIDPASNTYLPLNQLRQKFEAPAAFGRRTILYCGGGVSASLDAIALTMLGHQDIAIYDGSMYEWCMDPALPLVMGAEPG